MNWEIQIPQRVVFGAGKAMEAVPRILALGNRIAMVTGSDPRRSRWLSRALEDLGGQILTLTCLGEPTLDVLRERLDEIRRWGAQVVVGIGGGSALDLSKALAALALGGDDPMEHLEVVGGGQPISHPGLPCVTIPTTSGTGAEATRNAVIGASGVKASLRGPQLMPRLAVVDPTLALGVPAHTTACTGLDALVQLVEPLVSRHSTTFSDALCREGIPRSVRSLPRAIRDGSDLAARTDLAEASLFSGMALANAKLGAVHGLAAPLGGRLGAPHGELCARLMVPVWKANVKALSDREGGLDRYREVARLLCGSPEAGLDDGLEVLRTLSALAGNRGLSHWGLTGADIPAMREAGLRASSMKGNPVDLLPGEIDAILEEAL
ncbi:MAG TPA: iron-containing alcohol dehydrogenase [Fibrobacteria bacterium]|nr:iron-containing alcohol dehydrogenase [Fibrobacteria bacterium]HOX51302.1 iron-containing alcohol dehydrogenase [Fibrobacteria bacterium]